MPWYYPGYPSSTGGEDVDWVSAEFDSDGNIARLSDCDADGVPTQAENSAHFVENIDSDHNCWLIHHLSMSMYTMSNTTWVEKDAIIVHSDGNNDRTFDLDDNTGNGIRFGVADLTTATKPIVYGDCYYCYDSLYHDGTRQSHRVFRNTSSSFEDGHLELYGGVFEVWGILSGDGNIMYLPSGDSSNRTYIIGTSFTRFAGMYTGDAYGRFQEVLFSCSGRTGTALATTSDTIGYDALIHQNTKQSLAFGLSAGSNPVIKNVELRQSIDNYGIFYYYGESTPQTGYTVNSDEIVNLDPSSIIDGYTQSNSEFDIWFEERSTYDLKVVNTSSTDLEDVSVILKSNDRYVGFADEQEDYERILFSGETDSSGEITQQDITKKHWFPGSAPNKYAYDNYSLQLRKYGYVFYDSLRVFGYGINSGINDTVVLETDSFIVDNYATASTITGISVDFEDKKITLSEEVTVQNIYDYVSLQCAENTNHELTSYLPFTTTDGTVFILSPEWRLYNQEFISISDQIIEFNDGSRYVPIVLSGIVEGSRYYIKSGSDVLYYGEVNSFGLIEKVWTWYIDKSIQIDIRLKGYKPLIVNASINNVGLSIEINQIVDDIFTS